MAVPLSCLALTLSPLFAVDAPSEGASGPLWTTNQVLYLIAAIVIPVLGAAGFLLQILHRHYQERVRQVEADRNQAVNERDRVRERLANQNPAYDALRLKAEGLEKERDRLERKIRRLIAKGGGKGVESILADLARVQEEIKTLQGKLAEEQDIDPLTKEGLLKVAGALNLPAGLKSKSKGEVLNVVKSTVMNRRAMHERAAQ